MTDEQIIIGIQSESPNSAIRFLFKQEPKIKAYVLQHNVDKSDADDVFQETLITLCQNIKNETFEQQPSTVPTCSVSQKINGEIHYENRNQN